MDAKSLHEKLIAAKVVRQGQAQSGAEPKPEAKAAASPAARDNSVEFADEWMAKLFDAFQDQKVRDNKRIWEIGRIFVPISLSPFLLALDSSKGLEMFDLLICSGASLFLYLFWLVFAERHRNFQETSEKAQIKIVLQMSDASTASVDRLTRLVLPKTEERHGWPSVSVQNVRWFGFFLLLVVWAAVLLRSATAISSQSGGMKDPQKQQLEERPVTGTQHQPERIPESGVGQFPESRRETDTPHQPEQTPRAEPKQKVK